MSINQKTVHKIENYTAEVLDSLSNLEVVEFKLSDISIDNGFYLNGYKFSEKALKNVLYNLRIKKNFVDFSKKMEPNDWDDVSEKIKKAGGNVSMYAKIDTSGLHKSGIIETYEKNEKKKHADSVDIKKKIDFINQSLLETKKQYDLKEIYYENEKSLFHLDLIETDSSINPFGSDLDIWKKGSAFTFNGLQFLYAPSLDRLSCSNGARVNQKAFSTNVSKTSFNDFNINKVIKSAIVDENDDIRELLVTAVMHLKENNISIEEFYQFRNFFRSNKEKEERYDSLVRKFFDEEPFYSAYNTDVTKKSMKWRSSADAGINAYDFLNMLTYISSHPKESGIDQEDRLDLQIRSSNFLFKKSLDLEEIAGRVKVNYPKIAVMN